METIFSYELKKHETMYHLDHSSLENRDMRRSYSDRPIFNYSHSDTDEESFIKNYGNPFCTIRRDYVRLIVQANEEKVSIKLFDGTRFRRVGNRYFQILKNCEFLTISKKTGDCYRGKLVGYHKKRKFKKTFERNNFLHFNLLPFFQKLRNFTSDESESLEKQSKLFEAYAIFSKELGFPDNLETSLKENAIKFYLDKKNIKYPNNFSSFYNHYEDKIRLKDLRKNNNKLVDTYMDVYHLHGDVLKKALHNCQNTNRSVLKCCIRLFGESWVFQDYDLVLGCLNSKIPAFENYTFLGGVNYNLDSFSKKERRRIFNIFKNFVVLEPKINTQTFFDHIDFFDVLARLGEDNLSWKAVCEKSFSDEHVDLSSRIEYYVKGHYKRIYPKELYDILEMPIEHNDEIYYPILLDDTESYVDESSIQSNCVKSYIGNPGSYIISLRKSDKESSVRASVEFWLYNANNMYVSFRVKQALGRFNKRLDDFWNTPIKILQDRFSELLKDKNFKLVQIEKHFKTGKKLSSDTYWDENGLLKWSSVDITSYYD